MNKRHFPLVPEAEKRTIAVRAFVPSPKDEKNEGVKYPKTTRRGSSKWTLIFDTETTVDARQNLRVAAYQLRKGDELLERGLFYEQATLAAKEQVLVSEYAKANGLILHTRQSFVEEIFFQIAYEWRASIVGFNLPFDLSRVALDHSSARGKTMRGGFTFKLSKNRWWPNIQIKHLSSRNALIQFTKPPRRPDTRSERKRKITRSARRGTFIDVKTLAAALLSRSFSLASLSEFLETDHRKQASDEHGGPLTNDYLAYCLNDVQATWECYRTLRDKFDQHGLKDTNASQILSEAGLGKKYLQEMGVRPLLEVQPDFPHNLMGKILSAYYGGRSEVRWRREVKQVFYCDFQSMYPTVFSLMKLWRFVIAQGVTWRDTTIETKHFLDAIALADLQKSENWQRLTTIVRISPQADIFPVRAKYDGQSQTIGLNYLSNEQPLWYILADVIASKLLTGKTPQILEAVSFAAKEPQENLRPVAIAGNKEYEIDPETADFFKRLIDLRSTIKTKMKSARETEHRKLDAEQLALKILANATSYGIFVEVNVGDLDRRQTRDCFGSDGSSFPVETDKDEEPGKYFHPLLATLITGAARLMLATAESLILEAGLNWAFCDTDSMAIAKPSEMDQETFVAKAKSICSWYEPINPYEQKGFLFKVEDVNYGLTKDDEPKKLEPLYSFCISSKRYALFNLVDGLPVIRKASAHGLGHYLPPYDEAGAPTSIPSPSASLSDIGVDRWQYDLWFQIIRAELECHPEEVDLSYHEALGNPAASRYGATTPDLLRWFKSFNEGRPYEDQVKPFNFLISFQARFHLTSSETESFDPLRKSRRPKTYQPRPVAPFDKDIGKESQNAFDRETGKMVPAEDLKTYREALLRFHLCPEMKFLNGDYVDRGQTERRHIQVSGISHIGKEANRWEEQYFTGLDEDAQVDYGANEQNDSLDQRIRQMCKQHGERETAKRLGVARETLRKIHSKGYRTLSKSLRCLIEQNVSFEPH